MRCRWTFDAAQLSSLARRSKQPRGWSSGLRLLSSLSNIFRSSLVGRTRSATRESQGNSEAPISGFASRKVEALLIYLACTRRAQPREFLAELLWDERSQAQAMSNLRQVVFDLRHHLAPYVHVTRQTVCGGRLTDLA